MEVAFWIDVSRALKEPTTGSTRDLREIVRSNNTIITKKRSRDMLFFLIFTYCRAV